MKDRGLRYHIRRSHYSGDRLTGNTYWNGEGWIQWGKGLISFPDSKKGLEAAQVLAEKLGDCEPILLIAARSQ